MAFSSYLVFALLGLATLCPTIAFPTSSALSHNCADGSVLYAPSDPIPCNYQQSYDWCQSRGLRLATIKTASKQLCLEDLFNSNPVLRQKSAWVGMRRTINGNNFSFKWNLDGTPIQNSYTKWGYGLWPNLASNHQQPDNSGNCVHTWGTFQYTWNDNHCHATTVWGVNIVPVCDNLSPPSSGGSGGSGAAPGGGPSPFIGPDGEAIFPNE